MYEFVFPIFSFLKGDCFMVREYLALNENDALPVGSLVELDNELQ